MDPDKCKPCKPVTACLNTCQHCEICLGKPTLPADCRAAAEYRGGIGIMAGYAADTVLAHNEIGVVQPIAFELLGKARELAGNSGAPVEAVVIGDTNGFSDIFVADTLSGVITRISGANAAGGKAIAVKADVSKAADCEAMVKAAEDTYGKLNIIFNNAGRTNSMNVTNDETGFPGRPKMWQTLPSPRSN